MRKARAYYVSFNSGNFERTTFGSTKGVKSRVHDGQVASSKVKSRRTGVTGANAPMPLRALGGSFAGRWSSAQRTFAGALIRMKRGTANGARRSACVQRPSFFLCLHHRRRLVLGPRLTTEMILSRDAGRWSRGETAVSLSLSLSVRNNGHHGAATATTTRWGRWKKKSNETVRARDG